MKSRIKKTAAGNSHLDNNPNKWNSPQERMRTRVLEEEEKFILSRFDLSSDITVARLTEDELEVETDVPSILATLLDDFCGEVVMNDGEIVRYRFRKVGFNKKRIKRLSLIGCFGTKRFEPVAEIFIEYGGFRLGSVACHMPDAPLGNCCRIVPVTFGDGTERCEKCASVAEGAIVVVQDAILHRPRKVKHRDTERALEYLYGEGKPQVKKSGTTIKLGSSSVHIDSDRKFRWTNYWIVGGHLRQYQRDGVRKTSYIEPYLKGPERDSDEAKAFLAEYIKSDAARRKTIVL